MSENPTDATTTAPVTTPTFVEPTLDSGPAGGAAPGDDDDDGDAGAPLDEDSRRRVNTERRHRRAAEKRASDLQKQIDAQAARLKQFEDATKTDEQKRAEALEAAKAETRSAQTDAENARLELLRYQVGSEKQLSATLIPRLVGTTREELEADADRLAAEVEGRARPRKPLPDSRLGQNQQGAATPAEQFAAAVRNIM